MKGLVMVIQNVNARHKVTNSNVKDKELNLRWLYHILTIIGVQLHCTHGLIWAILGSMSLVPYNSFPQKPWDIKKIRTHIYSNTYGM